MTNPSRSLLMFGATGQVARSLAARHSGDRGTVRCLSRQEADVTRDEDIRRAIVSLKPNAVINATAYTAVDQAETDQDAAFRINRDAPVTMARLCHELAIPFLHISTDYVFDGAKTSPYLEIDPVNPLSVYGRSKEAGERGIREVCARHVILRTSWVYSPFGKNFLLTMLRLARERDEVSVVNDQLGSPTSAADIADALLAIAAQVTAGDKADAWGIFHFTAAGTTSWHGFAAEIFRCMGEQGLKKPLLTAIPTSRYPTPAHRPAYSVLNCERAQKTFGITPPPWQSSVTACLDRVLTATATT